MKKTLRRELFREIRKSMNRFLSILFISMLGVAFFTGVRASEPDMRQSMDDMADQASFMDFRVLCSYGLTEGDLAAIRETEGISCAEGEYSVDVLECSGEKQSVLHLMSLPESVNQLSLKEGRFPEKPGECVIDEQLTIISDYHIGSELQLKSGTADPLSDSLKHDSYTVVGTCTSPYYLDFERGSSTIGNGDVAGYVFLPASEFTLEVYTQIYARSDGLTPLLYTSDAYETLSDEIRAGIEEIVPERKEIRMEALVGDERRSLEEGWEEYEKGREEADKAFEEAETELQDAETKLSDGEKELEKNRKKLEDAKKTIEENEALLLEQENSLAASEAALSAREASVSAREQAYQQQRDAWSQAKTARDSKKREVRTKELEISFTEALQERAKSQKEELENALPEEFPEGEITDALEQGSEEIEAALDTAYEERLQTLRAELSALQAELSALEQNLQAHPQPDSSLQMSFLMERIAISTERTQLQNTRSQLQDGRKQLEQGKADYESGLSEFTEAEETLKEKREEYENALSEYETEKENTEKELEDALRELQDGEAELAKVKEPEWYVLGRETVPSYVGLSEDAAKIGALGKVFPVIFFLVAALVSLTTMTRMVEEHRTEIGTLKALGYSTGAIAGKYIIYALLATLTGSVAGFFLGEKILPYVIISAYQILYSNLQVMSIPYRAGEGIAATIFACVSTVGAAYFSCASTVKKVPAELMRPTAPKSGRKILLEHITPLWRVLRFSQKSALRNLFRYKKRLFMTIFGIGACMALLLVGFGLHDSIYVVSEKQFDDLWRYDGSVTLDAERSDKESAELIDHMEAEAGIKSLLPAQTRSLTGISGKTEKTVNMIVPLDTAVFPEFFSLRDRRSGEGKELSDEGAVITEKLSRQLNIGVGDTLRLRDDDLSTFSVTISDITENYVYQYIYMTPEYFAKATGQDPKENVIFFRFSEDADSGQISEDLLKEDAVTGLSQTEGLKRTINDMLSSLNLVIFVLILSAGLLAFVVLYNLNNINITERVRELATLRVLGYYDGETAVYVYRENVFLTILGIIAGVFMGKALHSFTIRTVEVDQIMFGRVIHPISFLWCILLTFLFALIVNFIMFFRIRKIDMVESLKSIE